MDSKLDNGPWHAGEIAMQETVGAVERMRDVGRRVIRDYMPDQHREFYNTLPFIVVGTVAADGTPFASIIAGKPGFVTTPDARTLVLEHNLPAGSDALPGLSIGASIGILGIELHSRRRNRVNGRITSVSGRRLEISVQHSFGNCPKYIQLKDSSSLDHAEIPGSAAYIHGIDLDEGQRSLIRDADTMFVATYVDLIDEEGHPTRQVDVSHRGGKPGFVGIADDDTLTIPDFAGNSFFNTLGNITLNPRAGLLFVNFEEGLTLQIEGSAEIVTGGQEVESFRGAERLWKVRPRSIRQSLGRVIPLAFSPQPDGLSVFLTGTGEWRAKNGHQGQAGSEWMRLRVDRVQDETNRTRSFHLVSANGDPLPRPLAGQHVSLRLSTTPESPPFVKTYTVSSPPDERYYRISVKKQGSGSAAVHERLTVGSVVDVRRPSGTFVLPEDADGALIFLAGGIGITPILAMLHELEARIAAGRKIGNATVIYAVSDALDFALLPELQAIGRRLAGKLHLIRLVSRPGRDDASFYDATGRLRGTLLKDCEFTTRTHAFVCGPDGFMRAAKDILLALGLPATNLHTEAFGSSGEQAQSEFHMVNAVTSTPSAPTPVKLSRSGLNAVWEPGRGNLLEFIESLGLQPDFSCRSGTCGTCRTRLLSGSVQGPMTTRLADGTAEILICSSYQTGDGELLVLDI